MKKLELNCVSEKIVKLIKTMEDNDEWNMAKSAVAEAYSMIVEAMTDRVNDSEQMQKYTSILIILNSYQEHLDLFHEEANRE